MKCKDCGKDNVPVPEYGLCFNCIFFRMDKNYMKATKEACDRLKGVARFPDGTILFDGMKSSREVNR